jgi:hypothetical protein
MTQPTTLERAEFVLKTIQKYKEKLNSTEFDTIILQIQFVVQDLKNGEKNEEMD